ncbi:hypothetical protein [Longispora urticae]
MPLARQLATGQLARDLAVLDRPAEPYATVQDALLQNYLDCRADVLDRHRGQLDWRARSRLDETAWLTRHDDEHLRVCADCGLLLPADVEHVDACPVCGTERLLDHVHRD